MTAQYLTFSVAGEEYAIAVSRVKQIMERGMLTHVPELPDWIPGIVNIRGSGVPVIDLAARFNVGDGHAAARACIVVLERGVGSGEFVGLLADAVSQVIEIVPADIQPPPPFGTAVAATFLEGLARAGEKFILILDVDQVLPDAALTAPKSGAASVPAQS